MKLGSHSQEPEVGGSRSASKKRAAVGYINSCEGCAYLNEEIRKSATRVDMELDVLCNVIDDQNVKINRLIELSIKQSAEIKGLLCHVRPSRAIALRKLLTDYRDKRAILAVPDFCRDYFSKVTKGVTCLNYYIRQGDGLAHDGVRLASIADAIESRQEGEAKSCFKVLFRSMYGDDEFRLYFPENPRIEKNEF
jgi:hypothetical protein